MNMPKRKHPAHMPPVEHHNRPILLFVTIGVQPRKPVLANQTFAETFVRACADADAWLIGRYVIMPDHIHFFCSPAKIADGSFKLWIRYLKERISKRLKMQTDQIEWKLQSDFWDTQIRNGEHYHQKWEYVRQNPVRKELVQKADEWRWQGELNVLAW